MKIASFALAAVIAATSLTAPAFAAGKINASSQTEEFSSAKRKRGHATFYEYVDPYTGEIHSVYRPKYLVPSSDFDGGYYAGEYAWRRSLGQCVEDLGYGRWKGC
jgi:hypothetical protein